MDFSYIQTIAPAMLQGLWQTVLIFVLTIAFSLPLGLPIAFGSMSRFVPLKVLSKAYVWVFRGTPLMLQLFFVYYGLPTFTPIVLDRLPAAVVTFVLNYAAYFAEIYRGGIQSIDNGQREASKSMGFAPWQTMRMIILPQAVRNVIPPISNEIITLVKDTSLVFVIGVPEFLKAAKDAVNRDTNPMAYVFAAAVYLILTFLLTVLSQQLEKRFSRHTRKDTA